MSPAFAQLHGLPPLLFQAGEAELFRDQVLACAERAAKAGVDAQVECYPDMIHAFQAMPQFFPEQSRRALRALEHLSGLRRQEGEKVPSRGRGPGA